MPLAAHSGMTACSGRRQSIEYCGWLETNGTRASGLAVPAAGRAVLLASAAGRAVLLASAAGRAVLLASAAGRAALLASAAGRAALRPMAAWICAGDHSLNPM